MSGFSRTKEAVLDQDFVDARSKLLDVAAFIDRVQRAEGEGDYRFRAFQEAVKEVLLPEPDRARAVLLAFSDPTTEPLEHATGKSASGAWKGAS